MVFGFGFHFVRFFFDLVFGFGLYLERLRLLDLVVIKYGARLLLQLRNQLRLLRHILELLECKDPLREQVNLLLLVQELLLIMFSFLKDLC